MVQVVEDIDRIKIAEIQSIIKQQDIRIGLNDVHGAPYSTDQSEVEDLFQFSSFIYRDKPISYQLRTSLSSLSFKLGLLADFLQSL